MTYVSVNGQNIRRNHKYKTDDPVIRVARGSRVVEYASDRVEVWHKGELVVSVLYRPTSPLSCGARVYLEIAPTCETRVIDPVTYRGEPVCRSSS